MSWKAEICYITTHTNKTYCWIHIPNSNLSLKKSGAFGNPGHIFSSKRIMLEALSKIHRYYLNGNTIKIMDTLHVETN